MRKERLKECEDYIVRIADELGAETGYSIEGSSSTVDAAYNIFRTSENIADITPNYKEDLGPLYDTDNAKNRFEEFSKDVENHNPNTTFSNFGIPHLMAFSSAYESLNYHFEGEADDHLFKTVVGTSSVTKDTETWLPRLLDRAYKSVVRNSEETQTIFQ